MLRRRAGLALGLAAVAAYALVWILLPSRDVHSDALDELRVLEEGRLPATAKHPADGPVLTALFRALRSLGYEGRAIRPIQVWNGAWMTAALAGLLAFAHRGRARWSVAAAIAAILAGTYASVHLAVDPFLAYYPPSLALLTWALALSLEGRQAVGPAARRVEWWAAIACLLGAVLFNPMAAIGCPLAALLWSRRAAGNDHARPAALPPWLGPLFLPIAALLTVLWILRIEEVLSGPFGGWREDTLRLLWTSSRESVIVAHSGFAPLRRGDRSLSAIVLTATYFGIPLALLAGAMLLSWTRSTAWRFLPFGLAAATCAAFVAWWDPGQIQFWVLPAWIAGLGAIHALPASAAVARGRFGAWPARLASAALVLEACLLWVSNGGLYVVRAATRPGPREQLVRELAERLVPEDLLVFLDWGDPALAFYSRLRYSSLLELHRYRQPGQSTLDFLRQNWRETRARGGTLYLEVPPPGQGWITPLGAALPGRDFDEPDFEEIRLGERLEFEGRVFHELLGFTSDGASSESR